MFASMSLNALFCLFWAMILTFAFCATYIWSVFYFQTVSLRKVIEAQAIE